MSFYDNSRNERSIPDSSQIKAMKAQQLDHTIPVSELINDFDLENLESELRLSIDAELEKLDYLHKESEKIGTPDNLGETIKKIVWDQFLNQIGRVAGEDFIKENRGLHFDPRLVSHTQTTEDFAEGKISKHNTIIDYQQRYDDWRKNFQFDEQGNIKVKYDSRSGEYRAVLTKNAREPFDNGRPKGSSTIHKDHTVPAAEIIRDPRINAHVTKEGQVAYANSNKNLNDLDAAANESKGDSSTKEWLGSKRDGKTPDERFNIDKDELLRQDKESRELKEKVTQEGEKQSLNAAKESQRQEIQRMGAQALRAVLMALLAELVRKIIQKLIKWFKAAHKTVKSLVESIKEAIISFLQDLKKNILTSVDIAISAVANAIIGPIASVIRSAIRMLNEGWKSLKEAFDYLTDPANEGKSIDILLMEVGKIIIGGSVAVGAIVMSEAIEKALLPIPGFGFNIPLLGSLANIIGIFLGAVISGIVGAIAINKIDMAIAEAKLRENREQIINQGNMILAKQEALIATDVLGIAKQKAKANMNITNRHNVLKAALSANNSIVNENTDEVRLQNDEILSDIINKLNS